MSTRPLRTLCSLSAGAALLAPSSAQTTLFTFDPGVYGFGAVYAHADLDGDGVQDLVVGAPLSSAVTTFSGEVFAYSLGQGGALIGGASLTGASFKGYYGAALAGMPDVGDVGSTILDGHAEVLIGAPGDQNPQFQHTGAAYLVSGAGWTYGGLTSFFPLYGEEEWDDFGRAVASLGDVNGDGYGDFAVSAPRRTVSGFDEGGTVYVYSGKTGLELHRTSLAQANAAYGTTLAGLGDVDGDGVGDYAVGAPGDDTKAVDAGAVYVRSGADGALLKVHYGPGAGNLFGSRLAGGADVDGDGAGDLAVGLPFSNAQGVEKGQVRVYSSLTTAPILVLDGEEAYDHFGSSVSLGDVDGDGRADVLVGSPDHGTKQGAAYLYSGRYGTRIARLDGYDFNDYAGTQCHALPDVNGAHPGEVVVTAGGKTLVYDGEFASTFTFCESAPNSAGPGATIGWSGSVDVSVEDFTLEVAGAVPGQYGIFFFGAEHTSAPFGDGVRCIGGSLKRITPALQVDAAGSASLTVDFDVPPATLIQPGSSWNFQFWYRDTPAGQSGYNVSDALSVTFCP